MGSLGVCAPLKPRWGSSGDAWGRGTDLVVQHEEQRAANAQVPRPLHLEPIGLLGGGCAVPLPGEGELGHLTGPSGLLGPGALGWSLIRVRAAEGTVVCGRVAVPRQKRSGSYLN